jgi:hypothetical protein
MGASAFLPKSSSASKREERVGVGGRDLQPDVERLDGRSLNQARVIVETEADGGFRRGDHSLGATVGDVKQERLPMSLTRVSCQGAP